MSSAELSVAWGDDIMRQGLLSLLPPVTVTALLLFWGNAPAALIDNRATLVIVIVTVVLFVQLLELRFERHEGWRINWRELATDLFYVVLGFTAISWMTDTFAEGPLRNTKETLGLTLPWLKTLPFLVQTFMVMALFEFGQYWMHRLMHNNALFWSTHAPHHHITQLNAAKGYVGNPIELFLISLSVIALFDFDKVAIFASASLGTAISTFAHANVRSDPPGWYSFFFTTIRHHSLHHTVLSYEDTRCNYGNVLILYDRIFGTYREGESAVVGQDERRRLTIAEQFLFPFRPLISRWKAKGA
jgi:sterol desaturase/sphingolipid hydroxylase (fatty acid hydroxylase superfamily)